MEDRKIDINIKGSSGANVGMVGAGMMDEVSMMNLQEMINGMMPKKSKKRKVSVAEARKILLEEEAAKLIDMDEVKEEAIRRAEEAGIIFIDEIDKIASGSKKGWRWPGCEPRRRTTRFASHCGRKFRKYKIWCD